MNQEHNLVVERQAKRYNLLQVIYQLSKGSTTVPVSIIDAGDAARLDSREEEDLLDYLEEEGLIKAFSDERSHVYITHAGVIEVEQSITNPAKATEHFTTQVIQHFHGAVGAVQNAAHSTANVTQNIGIDSAEVLRLIRELRESVNTLPTDQREDALQLVDSLEEEAQSPNPRKEKMKAYLRSIGSFASDTASNVLAEAIAKSLGLPS